MKPTVSGMGGGVDEVWYRGIFFFLCHLEVVHSLNKPNNTGGLRAILNKGKKPLNPQCLVRPSVRPSVWATIQGLRAYTVLLNIP